MTVPLIITIVLALASAAVIFAVLTILVRKIRTSSNAATTGIAEQVNQVSQQSEELSSYCDSYAPAHLMDTLNNQLEQFRTEIVGEAQKLKAVETRLDTAQRNIEQREASQQEIKSAKDNEESLLDDLKSKYDEYSTEAISLEQSLAQSLKNLDKMMNEIELTPDQRTSLDGLSEAMTTSGGRLRDLLSEYQVVTDRLQMLQQQHIDLENEYTKLVEQQLGE